MSNKTQKNQPKETASEHSKSVEEQSSVKSKSPVRLLLGILLVGMGVLAIVNGVSSVTDNKSRLLAPSGSITVEKVENVEDRTKGLSGRETLNGDEGMLFVFDDPSDSNCFWMKDMRFSIDMIWLNDDKQVVTVTENVSPETYPESFCPSESASYGLELIAGNAGELGIENGETLRF